MLVASGRQQWALQRRRLWLEMAPEMKGGRGASAGRSSATAAPRGSAQWCARVSCEALSPDHREFVFCEDKGTCVVEGLVCEEATFAKCHLRLRREQPPGETVVAETLTCGGGGEGFERVAWLQIEPSSAPSALAILRDGVEFAADPINRYNIARGVIRLAFWGARKLRG